MPELRIHDQVPMIARLLREAAERGEAYTYLVITSANEVRECESFSAALTLRVEDPGLQIFDLGLATVKDPA